MNEELKAAEIKMRQMEKVIYEGILSSSMNFSSEMRIVITNQAEIAGALAVICRALQTPAV